MAITGGASCSSWRANVAECFLSVVIDRLTEPKFEKGFFEAFVVVGAVTEEACCFPNGRRLRKDLNDDEPEACGIWEPGCSPTEGLLTDGRRVTDTRDMFVEENELGRALRTGRGVTTGMKD